MSQCLLVQGPHGDMSSTSKAGTCPRFVEWLLQAMVQQGFAQRLAFESVPLYVCSLQVLRLQAVNLGGVQAGRMALRCSAAAPKEVSQELPSCRSASPPAFVRCSD